LLDGLSEQPLTFAALDGIAFAAARGRLGIVPPKHVAAELGPLVELLQLARAGLLPKPLSVSWLRLDGSEALFQAAAGGADQWICPQGGRLGAFACRPAGASDESRWTSFQLGAHKAALAAGFPTQIVRRLMGAMGEIRDNVIEHSEAPATGFVAFRSQPGSFEFAVADGGIGTLASLRTNVQYAGLRDEGEALQCALTDGQSRFGKEVGRGTGFSQLFKSLVSLNASLRFRSGDHALSIEGKSPTLVSALVAKKPRSSGFFASVLCRSNDAAPRRQTGI
jgi:hypothetical protein